MANVTVKFKGIIRGLCSEIQNCDWFSGDPVEHFESTSISEAFTVNDVLCGLALDEWIFVLTVEVDGQKRSVSSKDMEQVIEFVESLEPLDINDYMSFEWIGRRVQNILNDNKKRVF